MTIRPLSDYDMSASRGFLCAHDPAGIHLKGKLSEIAEIARSLPDMLPTGRVRTWLSRALPQVEAADIEALTDLEARQAFVHVSFMIQAWVWGESEAPTSIPATLARPMVALSHRLGQPPLLTYSSYVLDNWSRLDKDGQISLDNTYMV